MMNEYRQKTVIEDGVVVGNIYNKQTTRNPIAKWMVNNFDKCFLDLIEPIKPAKIIEVGCGEGRLTKLLLEQTNALIHGIDISDSVLQTADKYLASNRVRLEKKSIYELTEQTEHKADLVVCCEVLEHLKNPRQGLERLQALAQPYCLLSVPNEPLWRTLNILRGSYWRDLGNTPGHIQHWNREEFVELISNFFHIKKIMKPLPWTMALCTSKK